MARSRPHANLSFLPWVRQGAAAAIAAATRSARSSPASPICRTLTVNDAPVPADDGAAARPGRRRRHRCEPGRAHRSAARQRATSSRTTFRRSSSTAPTSRGCSRRRSADANAKLRPWLCLVVVRKQDGVTLAQQRRLRRCRCCRSPRRRSRRRAARPRDCWAWAHAQAAARRHADGDVRDGAATARRSCRCRGWCARACSTPTPTTSRASCPPSSSVARLASACRSRTATHGGQCARAGVVDRRRDAADASRSCRSTTTGSSAPASGGDFESLARRLSRVRRRRTGPAHDRHQPARLRVAGRRSREARRSTSKARCSRATRRDAPAPWSDASHRRSRTRSRDIVNAPGAERGRSADADPLLAPPLYGRWHAARATVTRRRRDVVRPAQPRSALARGRRVRHAGRPGASGSADGVGVGAGGRAAAGQPAHAPAPAEHGRRREPARAAFLAARPRR